MQHYEPKVYNDLDEITQGREERWQDIQRKRAAWVTRGGYLEHASGFDRNARIVMVIVGILMAIGVSGLLWMAAR